MKYSLIGLIVVLFVLASSTAFAAYLTLNPNANGKYTDWDSKGCDPKSTDMWKCVDNVDPVTDDWIYTTSWYTNLKTTFNYEASGLGADDVINRVDVVYSAKNASEWRDHWNEWYPKYQKEGICFRPLLVIDNTDYLSTGGLICTTPTLTSYSAAYLTNPATGNPWTYSGVDALEAGMRSENLSLAGGGILGGGGNISQMYLRVSYVKPHVEVHIKSATPDSDSYYEVMGIENADGDYGETEIYVDSSGSSVSEEAYGYEFSASGDLAGENNPDYTWTTLTSPTSLTLGDDAVSDFIDMGFYTNFYGGSYDQVRISSNGFVTFADSTNHGCCQGQNLPDDNAPNNLIAGWWEDLRPASGGGTGTIKYETIGSSPDRKFIVQFDEVGHYGDNTKKVSFQIVISED